MPSIFENEDETIAGRVIGEFRQSPPDWSKYSLDEIQRAYGGLIGWRKKQRSRKKKNQEEWTQNGNHIRSIQTVLAGKWAERGRLHFLKKLQPCLSTVVILIGSITMTIFCSPN